MLYVNYMSGTNEGEVTASGGITDGLAHPTSNTASQKMI